MTKYIIPINVQIVNSRAIPLNWSRPNSKGKLGFKIHGKVAAFFLRLVCKIYTFEMNHKVYSVNKGSFKDAFRANLPNTPFSVENFIRACLQSRPTETPTPTFRPTPTPTPIARPKPEIQYSKIEPQQVEASKTPLPLIDRVIVEKDHPLYDGIPPESILKNGSYQSNDIFINKIDWNWLETPVSKFLKSPEPTFNAPFEEIMRHKLLKSRIEQLDKLVQIKERLTRLKNPENITLKDLTHPWNISQLKYLLMMDEEFVSLSAKEPYPKKDIYDTTDKISQRLADTKTLPRPNVKDVLLRDLSSLNSDSALSDIHPVNLTLIPEEVFSKLPLEKFDDYQLKEITQNKILLARLSKTQLDTLVQRKIDENNWVKEVPPLRAALIDPKLIDRKLFDLICSTDERRKEFISNLPLTSIYALQGLFKKEDWFWVSEETTINIDFTQITPLTKEIVENLINCLGYSNSKAEKIIPKLKLDTIYLIQDHLSEEHWEYLSDKQRIDFDYTKANKLNEIVSRVLSYSGYSRSKAQRIIPKLKLDTIYFIQDHLKDEQWGCLSNAQRIDFDYTKIKIGKLKHVVSTLLYHSGYSDSKAEKIIPKLKLDTIYFIQDHLDDNQWECLSEEQRVNFDYTKIKKDKLKHVVSILLHYSTYSGSKAQKLIPQLKPATLTYLNKANALDLDHYKCLSDNHVKTDLDFTQFNLTRDIIKNIVEFRAGSYLRDEERRKKFKELGADRQQLLLKNMDSRTKNFLTK